MHGRGAGRAAPPGAAAGQARERQGDALHPGGGPNLGGHLVLWVDRGGSALDEVVRRHCLLVLRHRSRHPVVVLGRVAQLRRQLARHLLGHLPVDRRRVRRPGHRLLTRRGGDGQRGQGGQAPQAPAPRAARPPRPGRQHHDRDHELDARGGDRDLRASAAVRRDPQGRARDDGQRRGRADRGYPGRPGLAPLAPPARLQDLPGAAQGRARGAAHVRRFRDQPADQAR
mmetsp:Transcript_47531/g.107759  ORF Transcript_47531/g.107759 Transcript_47531/m.107759 type:complete len:228 (-) Transcript_47531:2714-3397(-)